MRFYPENEIDHIRFAHEQYQYNRNETIDQAKEILRASPSCCECSTCKMWREHCQKALSLLEGVVGEIEPSAKAEQSLVGEFTKHIRETVNDYRYGWASILDKTQKMRTIKGALLEACDRLDAQAKEIERLKKQRWPSQERFDQAIAKEYAAELWKETYKKEIDRLTGENTALAEQIEKLKSYSRHTTECGWFVEGGLCTCGLEQTLKENTK